jgi:hypothetical protein
MIVRPTGRVSGQLLTTQASPTAAAGSSRVGAQTRREMTNEIGKTAQVGKDVSQCKAPSRVYAPSAASALFGM